ncbi:MAG: hypothetical protein JNJ56_01830 [Ignavibacteria bacterium]|nr:hypothetical protein [Ignavibacteria bacterium]
MKNLIFKSVSALVFMLIYIPAVFSQGNFYYFKNANMNIPLPANWVASEHILLLLMPRNEELQLKIELVPEVSLKDEVLNTINEFKNLYPDDTTYVLNDFVVNKLIIKEISKVINGEKLNYFIISTPDNQIVKIHYIAPKDIALKYNGDIQKIIKNLKLKG